MQSRSILQVAASAFHTICVTTEGELFSWGFGKRGVLGLGDEEIHLIPTKVEFFANRRVTFVAASNYCSAVVCDSALYSFGSENEVGLLGIGEKSGPIQFSPRKVKFPNDKPNFAIISVAVGNKHAAAVSRSGELYTWGSSESGALGVLGLPSNEPRTLPIKVSCLSSIICCECSVGESHTVALSSNGDAFLFGFGKEYARKLFPNLRKKSNPLYQSSRIVDKNSLRVVQVSASGLLTLATLSDGRSFVFVENNNNNNNNNKNNSNSNKNSNTNNNNSNSNSYNNNLKNNSISNRQNKINKSEISTNEEIEQMSRFQIPIAIPIIQSITDGSRILIVTEQNQLYQWNFVKQQQQTNEKQIIIIPNQDKSNQPTKLDLYRVKQVAVSKEHIACVVASAPRNLSGSFDLFKRNLSSLLQSAQLSDFSIVLAKDANKKIDLHRFILAARSPFFRDLFSKNKTLQKVTICFKI